MKDLPKQIFAAKLCLFADLAVFGFVEDHFTLVAN